MDEQNKDRQSAADKKLITWFIGFLLITGSIFGVVGYLVADIDPFFHYRAPDTTRYYYGLVSERNQNDGILRNFEYDAIITGTSMTQNFKASEFDELFGVHCVKTPFSGGSYREIGDRVKRALKSNDGIRIVLQSLDMDFFFMDYDDLGTMATGDYPTYLYDDNILNDYRYLLNRDILFDRVIPILKQASDENARPGITSFDAYSNWMPITIGTFGRNHVLEKELSNYPLHYWGLGDSDKLKIKRSISYNFLDVVRENPDVEFYYFLTPYSAAWWNAQMASGVLLRQVQAEQYIIELMLEYDNIHLYSFNTDTELITDLNNYKDMGHYGEWVNSAILRWMKDGTGLLTKDNYLAYIREEYSFYSAFDYTLLNDQIDYENDYDAADRLLSRFEQAEPAET